MSLQYAPTPEAKGKVERLHHYWQNRLPALFAADGIAAIDPANVLLEQLRAHHNSEENHRELYMTPQQAWQRAKRGKRSVTTSVRHPGHGSCIASTPTVRSASWRTSRTNNSVPNCFFTSVRSWSEKMSRFECYKIVPL